MDSRIIAIGLVITSGLIYTRIFENGFFKDIILIIIPSMLGVFVIKYIPNEWQQYKFKVSLKKEITDMFVKSVKRSFVVHDTAHIQLAKHYSRSEQPIDPNTGEIKITIVFPTEPDKQPLVALKNEYDEFKNEMKEIKMNGEILISKMQLYFDDEKVSKEFDKINVKAGECSQYLRNGFEAINKEVFLENLNIFHKESKILRNLSNNFESNLAKQKIKKIQV